MSIFVGSSEINDIYIGSNIVDNIFVGSNKVWSRPLIYDVTIGSHVPTAAGVELFGYSSSDVSNDPFGSLTLINNYQWFNNANPSSIWWVDFFSPSSSANEYVTVQILNQHANSDSVFKSVTINGTTFERSNADSYQYHTQGTVRSQWNWLTSTNPWSGTGNTDRVRFERDV